MAYDRERALRLVLTAMKPHLEVGTEEQLASIDDVICNVMQGFEEEPAFGNAFDAAIGAVWDAATYYALNPEG